VPGTHSLTDESRGCERSCHGRPDLLSQRGDVDARGGVDLEHRPASGHGPGHVVVPEFLDRSFGIKVASGAGARAPGITLRRDRRIAPAEHLHQVPGEIAQFGRGVAAVPDALQDRAGCLHGHGEQRRDAGPADRARGRDVRHRQHRHQGLLDGVLGDQREAECRGKCPGQGRFTARRRAGYDHVPARRPPIGHPLIVTTGRRPRRFPLPPVTDLTSHNI
jgi:hypothetical protein